MRTLNLLLLSKKTRVIITFSRKIDQAIFNFFHQTRPLLRILRQRLHDVITKTVEENGGNPTASEENSTVMVAGTAKEVPG